jgi:UDP-N-acetylglucosamine 2-epimerase (non-hydrolysing)
MVKKIALVVGARPNFMKSAPLLRQLQKFPELFEAQLIHTGQHYDYELSQLFFEQLKMKEPDIFLGVGSSSHANQTAQIMIKIEELFIENRPDLVVVFGDVNSTMASAIVASKLCIDMAHVEAGLRSFDNTMPEEINRIVTDRLSEYLFVSEDSGLNNLKNEGVSDDKVFLTGNIMIDSLISNFEKAKSSEILNQLSLKPREYATLTMHRPANVDNESTLGQFMDILISIGRKITVVFPCHPRTRNKLEEFELLNSVDKNAVKIIEPIGYLDFLKLQSESKFVLTDSGGIQEETTYMKIPCITLRENTERPATIEIGSNTLTGLDSAKINDAIDQIMDGSYKTGNIPKFWDGETSNRIVDILIERLD